MTATADLPPDTKAVVAALRKERWYEVTGSTLNVGPIVEQANAESGESEDVKKHLSLWARFRGQLEKRPRLIEHRPQLRNMADDIRWWEAAKAGVRVDDPEIKSWFWGASAEGRIELVKNERERRSAERRFKLAMKRNRSAA